MDYWPLCSAEWNHFCNFNKGIMRNISGICEIILNLNQRFRRCRLKISHLELWWSSHLVERNHLCNFCRGHYGEHSSKIILNLGQWLGGDVVWRKRWQTSDAHGKQTNHNSWPWAFASGELKTLKITPWFSLKGIDSKKPSLEPLRKKCIIWDPKIQLWKITKILNSVSL